MAFIYSSAALTTVERLKTLLNIPQDDTTNDLWHNAMINAVSRRVEIYMGRKLARRTYTREPYSGNGRQWLVLNNRPIISISNIQILDIAVTDYRTPTEEEAEAGMVFRQYGWLPGMLATRTGLDIGDPHPTYLFYNITVDYDAGYVSAAQADDPELITLDPGFELACVYEIDRQSSMLLAKGLKKQVTPVGHEEDYLPDGLTQETKDILDSFSNHYF